MGWAFVCKLVKDHDWERMRTHEEAYRCLRCGKRHYGPIRGLDMTALLPPPGG